MAAETSHPRARGWYWTKVKDDENWAWVPEVWTGSVWASATEPAIVGPRILTPDETKFELNTRGPVPGEFDFEQSTRQNVTAAFDTLACYGRKSEPNVDDHAWTRLECLKLAHSVFKGIDVLAGPSLITDRAELYFQYVTGESVPKGQPHSRAVMGGGGEIVWPERQDPTNFNRRDPTAEFNGA